MSSSGKGSGRLELAPGDLISLQKAAGRTGLSASHLRLLVRQGKVWGIKVGRDWLTTERAVREYLAGDRRPGPKKLSSR
jgi:excisionase family DNA binding protein